MSAVLGPLPLDQLPKSKPVTPMLSCLVSPETHAASHCDASQPSLVVQATGSTRGGQPGFPGDTPTQRVGAESRKLRANGAADAWGDAVNSTAAKAMSPR